MTSDSAKKSRPEGRQNYSRQSANRSRRFMGSMLTVLPSALYQASANPAVGERRTGGSDRSSTELDMTELSSAWRCARRTMLF